MSRSTRAQAVAFLLAGGFNTAATYLLYLALLLRLSYPWAYSLSYVVGIVLSFVINSRWVFRVPLRWSRLVPYPLVYAVQYSLGLAVLRFAVGGAGLDPRWAPAVVLAVTLPATFVLTRLILVKREKKGREERED